jgi:hypothetical protein
MDDLFLLFNGFISNVQIMIIRFCRRRISIQNESHPQRTSTSFHLTDFTLIDCCSNVVMYNIKSTFRFYG